MYIVARKATLGSAGRSYFEEIGVEEMNQNLIH